MHIEMDPEEAFVTMEAVQREAQDWLIRSAVTRGVKGEYAEVRSKVLQRVASRLAGKLMPEPDPRRAILEDEIEFGIV